MKRPVQSRPSGRGMPLLNKSAILLCAASRPVSAFPLSRSRSPGLPRRHVVTGQRIKINPTRRVRRLQMYLGPSVEIDRRKLRRSQSIQDEMHVARGGTIGNDRDRLGGGMRRVVLDLYVKDGRQATQTLCPYAERVHFLVDLKPQFLQPILRAARLEFMNVD